MRYCEELCLAVQGCMQIVKLWAILPSSDDWPRRRSMRVAVNFRSFRCGAAGWGGDLDLWFAGGSPGTLAWGEPGVCAGVLLGLWWRCFGLGWSLGLVPGGAVLGGQFAGGGAGRGLPGWVGSVSEAHYRA